MYKRPPSTLDPSKIETPAYVIEEDLLRHNLAILKDVRDKTGCKVFHALKAWATWPLFNITRDYLSGTEVSSLNEARLGFDEFGPEVHMYAPAYKPEEFKNVLKYSSTVIFNSFSQWKQFRRKVKNSKKPIEVGLRVNPEICDKDGHGEMWNPCAPDSRLGIRISEFKAALEKDPTALEGVSGLHFHIFFEKTLEDLKAAIPVIEASFGPYLSRVKWVNFGGGQKISDDDYDQEGLIALIKDFQTRHGVQVHLEPGAAVAWQTGTLVATVLDIVTRSDVPYKMPILDMSFDAHLTDFTISTDLDLRIRGAEIVRDPAEYAGKPNLYKFGGGTCLAGDKLAYLHSFAEPLKVGDKIVFEDAIQYTLVKTTMFNGVQHPSIVLWKNGAPQTLRKFGYKDFKGRMG
jgi:carboxynorspermidine decarboxylase